MIIVEEQASYLGDVENCEPKYNGQAKIVTKKDYVFDGIVRDKGTTRIGKYTLLDGTEIGGTFTGDGLNGWFTVTYANGLQCTETWAAGKRTDSIGEDECKDKVKD